ncbi:DUF4231 domain-containing protein [Cyclobacterium jeungdonense]|uniref:DUF4231 domain-containing protein n=1 Tax=Cyclobacterium jeungdonense TaxID=708087 RepID=A0ABT8CBI3_9BACT|nr:DUF4231 domain-containing protein [Cyclobacterium jeungdonense]MDN3689041.1 DUF4231 domain-containing protein [Cyclobacterium jeungdonense]
MAAIDFLKSELDSQIERFEKESTKHKRMYRWIKNTTFILAGVSTVLAGIAVGSETSQYYLTIGILVTTAAISILNSIEGLRKPGELWIMERNLFNALKDLKRDMEFDLEENKGAIPVSDYFDKMQSLLNSAGEKWIQKVGNRNKNQ